MKRAVLNILKLTGVFAVTAAILFSLLFLAALIPNEKIEDNMIKTAQSYKNTDAFEFSESDRLGEITDNYADSILLNISWNMGKGNAVKSALDTGYYDGGDLGENFGLYATVVKGAEPNTDYTRYVHGSAGFVRLLHLFTDVQGIKTVGLLCICALVIVTLFMLCRGGHIDLGLMLLLSLAAVGLWNVALSLEYIPTFIICFLLCPFYLWLEKKGNGYLCVLSVIGGTLVAFFDFLTTETVALLVPFILIFAVRAKENRLGAIKENLILFLKNAVSFGAAYAATFLVKWTAATAVTGENKFAAALASVGERVGGAAEGLPSNVFARIPAAVAANLSALFGGSERLDIGRAVLFSAITLAVLFSVVFLFRKKEINKGAAVLPLMPAATVILRFAVLSNHSFLHCFFTYRALCSVVLALLVSASFCISLKPEKKKGKKGVKG